jgi:predicted PurR-regulated permease PerM
MDNPESSKPAVRSKQIIHIALQLLALAFLIGWCFQILDPFFTPLIWGAILAVSLYPLHQRLKKIMKGKGVLAAVLMTGFLLGLFIFIGGWLGIRTGAEIKNEITALQEGKIKIPPPPESVKHWPVVGRKTYLIWTQLTTGVESVIQKYPE